MEILIGKIFYANYMFFKIGVRLNIHIVKTGKNHHSVTFSERQEDYYVIGGFPCKSQNNLKTVSGAPESLNSKAPLFNFTETPVGTIVA